MSEQERSDIRDLKEMLAGHMKASSENSSAIMTKLGQLETHNQYTKETLTNHDRTLNDVVSDQNKLKGIAAVLGFIGLGFIVDIAKRMFS